MDAGKFTEPGIMRRFGHRRKTTKPGVGRGWYRSHAGVDLYAPAGTEVRAVTSGKVIEVIDKFIRTGLGRNDWASVVSVDHGDYVIRYCEMTKSSITKKKDDSVKTGEVIGKVALIKWTKLDNGIRKLTGETSSMLHLEMYAKGSKPPFGASYKDSVKDSNGRVYRRRIAPIDPTEFLKKLM